MKNSSVNLSVKQEQQRQITINKVLRAIQDVNSEGSTVNIVNLVEFTGLSQSVFLKSHIRELPVDYGYGSKDEVKPK